MYIDIILLFIIIVILILGSLLLYYISKTALVGNEKISDNTYRYSDMYSEFRDFSLVIIARLVLEKLLKSETDANGSKIALREISSISEPFYQGVIVTVVGSMSEQMKTRFFLFYKQTKDLSHLIISVSSLIEIYTMNIMRRIKKYEDEANITNRDSVSRHKDTNTPPRLLDVKEYTYGKMIQSIVEDIKYVNMLNNNEKQV